MLAADFTLLWVTVFWGATFVVVQEAIRDIHVYYFLAIRFTLAAAVLSLMVPLMKRRFTREVMVPGFILGTVLFFSYVFQTFGLALTTPSNAGFITGLAVAIVPIMSALVLKRPPAKSAVIGVGLAVIGLFLMTGYGPGSFNDGDLLVLVCAFLVAVQIILTGHFAPRHDPLVLASVMIQTVAAWSWAGYIVFSPKGETVTGTAWFGILVTALLATVFAFWAQTAMQRITTPTRTALIFAGEPVFAAIFDYLYNGRVLGTAGYIGGLLILAGMVVAEISPRIWSAEAAYGETEGP
jgi:drug/metabolite transporter (DMT)-like permease